MKPFFYDNLKDKFIKIRNDWIKEHGNFTEIVMIQGTSIRNISYKKAKM